MELRKEDSNYVVADLEETFGLRIPEKELRNFVTVSDLADYLAAHAGE